MQIAVSIEPYLVFGKEKLTQYIEKIIQISHDLNQNGEKRVCLHFDYFKPNLEIFRLVQKYAHQIEIDLHLMHETAPSANGFRSVSFDAADWQKVFPQLSHEDNLLAGSLPDVNPSVRGLVLDLGCRIENYVDAICSAHYIVIMTVKCGKSGQTFQSSALQLIPQVRRLNPDAVIIVDGGVNKSNIDQLKIAGVDVAVVGNYAKKCYENGNLAIGINRLLHN